MPSCSIVNDVFIKTNSHKEKMQTACPFLSLFTAFFRFCPFLVFSKIGKDWKRSEKIDPGWTHLVLVVPNRNTASRTRYTFASSIAANTGRPVARQGLTVRNLTINYYGLFIGN